MNTSYRKDVYGKHFYMQYQLHFLGTSFLPVSSRMRVAKLLSIVKSTSRVPTKYNNTVVHPESRAPSYCL